jgi:hypothetical protein
MPRHHSSAAPLAWLYAGLIAPSKQEAERCYLRAQENAPPPSQAELALTTQLFRVLP